MFRLTSKVRNISRISKPKQCFRYYSENTEKSNSAKVGVIIGSSLVVLSGLSLGYAKYDSGFRKKIENSVPYSHKLLNSLLGPIIPSITESKDSPLETSFLNKKKERTDTSLNINNSIKAVNTSTNESKTEDKIDKNLESKQMNEKTDTKKKNDSDESSSKSEAFNEKLKEEIKEEENPTDPSIDSDKSLFDIDVMIAREALKDQLLTVLPSDGHEYKELQKRFNDIELEYERKITRLEEKYELEIKNQLKRQLSAFNDHLTDQMSNLRQQLQRNYDNSLEERLLEEKNRFQSELSNSFYRLQLLDQFLKAREDLDRDQYSSRKLWVLCQTLREALNYCPSIADECLPISLTREMSVIQSIISGDHLKERPVIRLALESIPKDVSKDGVYTETNLIKRFSKVDKYCKRVALIGDNGGSLYKYILSYLQSLLIFRDSKIPIEELEDKEVDPLKWDTFDLLTRIQYHLQNHNLEMALKYANQLKGEPRNVAKDWIRDTRIHLEVKQAIDLLQSEADAINVQIVN